MIAANLVTLRAMLKRHEGVRSTMYLDTLGIPTIGVGRNLRDKGLSSAEVDYLLDNDIMEIEHALHQQFVWFASLPVPRQLALIDMGFMGPKKLDGFTQMVAAFAAGDYVEAARQMLASKWSDQVGQRAQELAAIVRSGAIT
jgi:lysozyme